MTKIKLHFTSNPNLVFPHRMLLLSVVLLKMTVGRSGSSAVLTKKRMLHRLPLSS
jgi:hypothetical protein